MIQSRIYSSSSDSTDNFPPSHLDLNQFTLDERKRIHVCILCTLFILIMQQFAVSAIRR